jgi:hypothetical protein
VIGQRTLAVLLLVAGSVLIPTAAEAADSWSSAGSMTSKRANAMGTRLANGRVLVAGGDTGSGVTNTAEVFDPATNGWTPVASMASPRIGAPAIALKDGRVLVPGGRFNIYDASAASEVFDPTTGKWSPVAPMLVARGYHDGLLLDDGRALVFGGDGIYDKTKGAELWNPASDTWKATGPVVTTRFEPAFAKMPDGRVLVAGGWNGDELASAEIYDPAADTWTAVAPMSETRGNPEAATLPDGRVLVAGGHGFEDLHPTVSRTAEIYDPRTNTWTKTADLNTPRGEASVMVTLDDGRPAIIGGFWWSIINPPVGGGLPTWWGERYEDTLEIYDPATGTWAQSSRMRQGRSGHLAMVLADGSLLVAGGYYPPTATAERFGSVVEPPPTATPTPEPIATASPTPVPTPTPTKPGTPGFGKLAKRFTLSKKGTFAVKLACSAAGECKDTLVLKAGKTTLAKAPFKLGKGKTATVTLKLSKASLRKISRKGTKVTLELTGRHVVVKTTVKKP